LAASPEVAALTAGAAGSESGGMVVIVNSLLRGDRDQISTLRRTGRRWLT
jgi:hypothetical protein